ncbi:MAG: hypothetical protein GZ088_15965 [Acidipila sp.]|nr:hypothetical protein [Acidipila sp.]
MSKFIPAAAEKNHYFVPVTRPEPAPADPVLARMPLERIHAELERRARADAKAHAIIRGGMLKRLRLRMSISQGELAVVQHCSQPSVVRVEAGLNPRLCENMLAYLEQTQKERQENHARKLAAAAVQDAMREKLKRESEEP